MKLKNTLVIIILFVASTTVQAKKKGDYHYSSNVQIVIGADGTYNFALPTDIYTTYKIETEKSVQRIYSGSRNLVSTAIYQYEIEELKNIENFILQDANDLFPEANFELADLKKDKTYFGDAHFHLYVHKSKMHDNKSVNLAYYIRGQVVVIMNVLDEGAVQYKSPYIFKSFQWDLQKSNDAKTGMTLKVMPGKTDISQLDSNKLKLDFNIAQIYTYEKSVITVTKMSNGFEEKDICRLQKKYLKQKKPVAVDKSSPSENVLTFRYLIIEKTWQNTYDVVYKLYQDTYHYITKDGYCYEFYLRQNLDNKTNFSNPDKSPYIKESLKNGYRGLFQAEFEEAWFFYMLKNISWTRKS
jgi:hypothetical protein